MAYDEEITIATRTAANVSAKIAGPLVYSVNAGATI